MMIEEYRNKLDKINKAVNTVYGRLTFSTIADVLEGDIDLRGLWYKLNELYNKSFEIRKSTQSWLDSNYDEDSDEFHDLDMEIDDLHRVTTDKIDAVQELINGLEDIVSHDDEYGIKKYFQDIKQINI